MGKLTRQNLELEGKPRGKRVKRSDMTLQRDKPMRIKSLEELQRERNERDGCR